MTANEKEIIRMELQIGQLITIVANLNDRLNRLEELERMKQRHGIRQVPLAEMI